MPRDSQGNYTLPGGTLVNVGDTVVPSQHNPAFQDVAQGLRDSLDRNGSGGMLADLDMNSFALQNVSALGVKGKATAQTLALANGPVIGAASANRLSLSNDGSTKERLAIGSDGTVYIAGSRAPGGPADYAGSGNVRVPARAPGGTAISTFDTQDYTSIQFVRQVSGVPQQVGSIACGLNSTAYLTSSDYRLKENVVPLAGALATVVTTPVHSFNFIGQPGVRVDGFLAHEAALAVPEAVHGAKDAVDANGKPVYQAIDQSKLVPKLWAAVQELAALNAALLTRIEAIEAQP